MTASAVGRPQPRRRRLTKCMCGVGLTTPTSCGRQGPLASNFHTNRYTCRPTTDCGMFVVWQLNANVVFIHSRIYIAPLQENYSEVLQVQLDQPQGHPNLYC